jgi:hypothetical protein
MKWLACGAGVNLSLNLVESTLFLRNSEHTPATLRGSLDISVTETVSIKQITIMFLGQVTMKWEEKKSAYSSREKTVPIASNIWKIYGAPDFEASKIIHMVLDAGRKLIGRGPMTSTKDASASTSTSKHRVFEPGLYTYDFTLVLSSQYPGTIEVGPSSVKYQLQVAVERAHSFRARLSRTREVILIHTPPEDSLEMVEPIAVDGRMGNHLHYNIAVLGKMFPLGTRIPIQYRLTPSDGARCHSITISILETVEYYGANRVAHYAKCSRKVQLAKEQVGQLISALPGSTSSAILKSIDENTKAGAMCDRSCEGETQLDLQLPSCFHSNDILRGLHYDTTGENIQVKHSIQV